MTNKQPFKTLSLRLRADLADAAQAAADKAGMSRAELLEMAIAIGLDKLKPSLDGNLLKRVAALELKFQAMEHEFGKIRLDQKDRKSAR